MLCSHKWVRVTTAWKMSSGLQISSNPLQRRTNWKANYRMSKQMWNKIRKLRGDTPNYYRRTKVKLTYRKSTLRPVNKVPSFVYSMSKTR